MGKRNSKPRPAREYTPAEQAANQRRAEAKAGPAPYWICRFTDGSMYLARAHEEYDARAAAEKASGKTVAGGGAADFDMKEVVFDKPAYWDNKINSKDKPGWYVNLRWAYGRSIAYCRGPYTDNIIAMRDAQKTGSL